MKNEAKRVRAALAGMVRGRGRRFSPGIRRMVAGAAAGLREQGQSWKSIGRALDLPAETARRLCHAAEDGKMRGGFVRVVVADEASGKGERSGLVLVSPSGYRVEGLDAEQAADLLTRLR